jgi:hypothetical protein
MTDPVPRQQYAFRPSPGGLKAWDVHRLIGLAADLPVKDVALADIREIDQTCWYEPDDPPPACRSILVDAEPVFRAELR